MLVKHTIDYNGNLISKEIIDPNATNNNDALIQYYVNQLKKLARQKSQAKEMK